MLVMAAMVEAAIERGIEALKTRDVDLAHQIIADDIKINRRRYETEEKCLELIATQQPLAATCAPSSPSCTSPSTSSAWGTTPRASPRSRSCWPMKPPLKPYIDIPRMAEIATDMLMGSLEAFKQRDPDRARAICEQDDEVDALYEQVYRELLTFMINDPKTIERATHLLWVAHNLERIADRVTNICERVVYLVEGKIEELNVSKY